MELPWVRASLSRGGALKESAHHHHHHPPEMARGDGLPATGQRAAPDGARLRVRRQLLRHIHTCFYVALFALLRVIQPTTQTRTHTAPGEKGMEAFEIAGGPSSGLWAWEGWKERDDGKRA